MPYKCCVPKCTSSGEMLHNFPKDDELLKIWCRAIGRQDLLNKDSTVVQKYFKVCDKHFAADAKFDMFHNRTNLKYGRIIPTLHILGDIPCESAQRDEPQMVLFESQNEEATNEPPTTAAAIPLQNVSAADVNIGAVIESTPSTSKSGHTNPSSVVKKRTKDKDIVLKKRRNLLLELKLKKKAQLTPKAAQLYRIASDYRRIAKQLQYKAEDNETRIRKAKEQADLDQMLQRKVNPATYNFLTSQITQQSKRPKGRRFSLNDKILALSLLKQSGRGYRLLQKIFALPSRHTLMSLLKKVPFEAGVNEAIFNNLKEQVKQLKESDKHCVLLFDEMSLQPFLTYHKAGQYIDGFQENSGGTSSKIADHAIVFMLRGLGKQWKQPLAYFFSQNGMSNSEIAANIKIMIRKVHDIGLTVDATVCDQYNKAAINYLVDETKRNAAQMERQHESFSFMVDGKEVFPLFDFPHLLKGIRNNLLKYNVKFAWRNGEEIAAWTHLETLYDLDQGEDDYRMLNKLTDEHIKRDRIKKMKVKHAAQVFSHRVQSTIRGLIQHGTTVLPKEAIGTANFVLFMDKVFDSVNGSAVEPNDGKLLRRAVTPRTGHVQFWHEAIKVFGTMKFFEGRKEVVPPSVTNWILSLRNMKLIWTKLHTAGFDFLLPRNLNQDPLENFFSCIRSHGVRNINPSCTAFKNAFKSLIINNFMSSHSVHANCEADDSSGALDSLRNFIDSAAPVTELVLPIDYGAESFEVHAVANDHMVKTHAYVAGYLARKILKTLGGCKLCKAELSTDAYTMEHQFIEAREYKRGALLKPRTKFVVLFGLCQQIVTNFLPKICSEQLIEMKLFALIKHNVTPNIFSLCPEHDLFKVFVRQFIHLHCFTWVNTVNRILKGSLRTVGNTDPIKVQALRLHNKYRARYLKTRENKRLA